MGLRTSCFSRMNCIRDLLRSNRPLVDSRIQLAAIGKRTRSGSHSMENRHFAVPFEQGIRHVVLNRAGIPFVQADSKSLQTVRMFPTRVSMLAPGALPPVRISTPRLNRVMLAFPVLGLPIGLLVLVAGWWTDSSLLAVTGGTIIGLSISPDRYSKLEAVMEAMPFVRMFALLLTLRAGTTNFVGRSVERHDSTIVGADSRALEDAGSWIG
jgi:hypothetical protein